MAKVKQSKKEEQSIIRTIRECLSESCVIGGFVKKTPHTRQAKPDHHIILLSFSLLTGERKQTNFHPKGRMASLCPNYVLVGIQ